MFQHRPTPETTQLRTELERLAMVNKNQMIHPRRSEDEHDAALNAALASADEDMLTAISNGLDLDAGLARVIGDLDGASANRPDIQSPAYAGEDRKIPDASFYRDRSSRAVNASNEAVEERFQCSQQTTDTDAALHAHATATIKRLLEEHPAVAKATRDALRARVHLQELAGRTSQAEVTAADAEQHEANLAVKLDPGDHRRLSFGLGLAIVVALVILDAVLLNWAAQAFGLNSAGTWLVTFTLVVASIGAMLGFEITRGNPRRRGALAAVVTMGYLALLALRTEFLITVSSESLPVALLQSTLLTAIFAGLVLCGSAVLARTRYFSHSRARVAARRAARAADAARAAQRQAAEKLQRHIGSLHHMLLPWALRSAAPEGVDHAAWYAALDQTIRALYTGSEENAYSRRC
jgi:hypothetical protein